MDKDGTDTDAKANRSLPQAAIAALALARKIDAIKIVRQERGVDLKAANDAVDMYLRQHPDLPRKVAAAQAETKHGCLRWLAALVVSIVVIYLWRHFR